MTGWGEPGLGWAGGEEIDPRLGRDALMYLVFFFLRLLSAADGSAGLPRCLFSAALEIKHCLSFVVPGGGGRCAACALGRLGGVMCGAIRRGIGVLTQSRTAPLGSGPALKKGGDRCFCFYMGAVLNFPLVQGAWLVEHRYRLPTFSTSKGSPVHRYLRRFNN